MSEGETSIAKGRRLGIAKTFVAQSIVDRVKLGDVIKRTPLPTLEISRLKVLHFNANKAATCEAKLAEKGTECGRMYPENYAAGGAITCRGPVRGALYGRHYVEVDMAAAHPTAFAYLARQSGIPTPAVCRYLSSRTRYLKGVARAFRRSEEHAKRLFNAALYGSRNNTVVGDDGVSREIDKTIDGDDEAEECRRLLQMYIREVQDVTGKLLKDPKIQKDHAPNLKRVWDSKEASQLFKLLEVVERFAIHAMLKAIEETGGEFVPGEIIFDGILVRHKDGGDPGSWDDVLAARPEQTTPGRMLAGREPRLWAPGEARAPREIA